MKKVLSTALCVAAVGLSAQTNAAQYPIQPVPLKQVTLTDGFWKTRLETNRTVTIPHILEQNEKTGRVDNLRKGAGQMPGDYQGRRFNDTDIYKIIEAASYSLATHPDPALSKSVDDLIALIAKNSAAGRLSVSGAHDQSRQAGGRHRHRALAVREHRQPRALQLRTSDRSRGRALQPRPASGRCSTSRSRTRICSRPCSARKRDRTRPDTKRSSWRCSASTARPAIARYLDLAKLLRRRARHESHRVEGLHRAVVAALQRSPVPAGRQAGASSRRRRQGHAVRAVYLYAAMTDIAALQNDPKFLAAARSALAGHRLEADVSHRRPRIGRRHRGVRR